MTICTKCTHYLYDPNNEDIWQASPRWYWQYCKAHPKPESINPCTGEKGYQGTNDLGGAYYSNVGFQYCRDINQGDCPTFEAKKTWRELMLPT